MPLLKDILVRLTGLVLLLVGLTMAGWIGYNLFVQPQAEYTATTADTPRAGPRGFIVFAGVALFGGSLLFRRRPGGDKPEERV